MDLKVTRAFPNLTFLAQGMPSRIHRYLTLGQKFKSARFLVTVRPEALQGLLETGLSSSRAHAFTSKSLIGILSKVKPSMK